MDLNKIKNIILNTIKTYINKTVIKQFLKELISLPYAKVYLFVLPIFFIFLFLILTFPYELYIRDKIKGLEGKMVRSIYISELDFSLFGKTTMSNIYIILSSGNEINIRDAWINIAINPVTLLMNNDIKGEFDINGLKYSSDDTDISLNLGGNIDLDFISFSRRPLIPSKGQITVTFENANVGLGEIKLPGNMGGMPIKLPPMKLNAHIKLNIKNKKISLSQTTINGKDLKGNITGTITLGRNLLASRMDVKITIDTESKVMEKYKDFLATYIDDSNMLVIPLRGSLLNPRLDINQMDSDKTPLKTDEDAPEVPTGKDSGMDILDKTIPGLPK